MLSCSSLVSTGGFTVLPGDFWSGKQKERKKIKKEMKACRKMGKDIRIKMFLKKKKEKKKEKERKKEAEVCSSLCHSSCNSKHQRETTPWPACRCRRQPELRWGAGQSAARRRSDTWRRAGGRARPAQCGAAPGSSRRPRVLLGDAEGPAGFVPQRFCFPCKEWPGYKRISRSFFLISLC